MKLEDIKDKVRKDIQIKLQKQIENFQTRLKLAKYKNKCIKKEIQIVKDLLENKAVVTKNARLLQIPIAEYNNNLENPYLTEIDFEILDAGYENLIAYFYEIIVISCAYPLEAFYEDENHLSSYAKGKYIFALTACYLLEYLEWLENHIPTKLKLSSLTQTNNSKKNKSLIPKSFDKLFPQNENRKSWYDSFIQLLIKWGMIDKHLKWIDDDPHEFIRIFWALKQLKYNSTPFLKVTNNKEFTDLVYSHFHIDSTVRGWGKEAFRREDRHHFYKVKESIDSDIQRLESNLF